MRDNGFTVTMGALVLGGLLEAGYGSADAPRGSQGVPSELPDVTQNRNKDYAGGTAVCHFAGIHKRRGAR